MQNLPVWSIIEKFALINRENVPNVCEFNFKNRRNIDWSKIKINFIIPWSLLICSYSNKAKIESKIWIISKALYEEMADFNKILDILGAIMILFDNTDENSPWERKDTISMFEITFLIICISCGSSECLW